MTWLVSPGTSCSARSCSASSCSPRTSPTSRDRGVACSGGTPVVVVVALGTTAYGLYEAAMPTVTPVTVTSPSCPAFDGLQVALVTDLHVGPVRDASFTQRVVDQVNAQSPTSSYSAATSSTDASSRSPTRSPRSPSSRPRSGVFAVSGNHEFISQEADAWLAHWESLGITVLRNEDVALAGLATIRIAGVHDETGTGADAADVDGALGRARDRLHDPRGAPAPAGSRGAGPRHRPAALGAHPRRAGVAVPPCGSSSRSSTVSAWSATYRY